MTEPTTSALTILQYFDSFLTLMTLAIVVWAFFSGKVLPRVVVDEIIKKNSETLAGSINKAMENSVERGIVSAFAKMGIKGRRESDPPPVWLQQVDDKGD